VSGPEAGQATADDLPGELGQIAIAAEMAKKKVLQVCRHNLRSDLGGGFVGQVTMPAEDSLLGAPRTSSIFLEHFDIMIGFEDQNVGGADSFDDKPGGVAEIGEKTEIAALGAEQKSDGIIGVVGDAEGLDVDAAELEGGPRTEEAKIELLSELQLDGFFGEAIAIDGNLKLGGEHAEALGVVGMFVGNKNSAQVFRRPTDAQQTLADLARAQSRVEQQARVLRFQVGAVATGTAGEDGQSCRHAATLETGRHLGNGIKIDRIVSRRLLQRGLPRFVKLLPRREKASSVPLYPCLPSNRCI